MLGPKLLEVRIILVAHKEHPVFLHHSRQISRTELQKYKEIHYQRPGKTVEILGNTQRQLWVVNSVESAVAAIRAKMCFGAIPEHSVSHLLVSGELKQIEIPYAECSIPLYLVVRNSPTLGEATEYLASLVLECCK